LLALAYALEPSVLKQRTGLLGSIFERCLRR
jgi:hypothetical protein